MEATIGELLEIKRKYDASKEKHNKRCYKYYYENHDIIKAKRNEYAKKYYQQKKDRLKLLQQEIQNGEESDDSETN